MTESEKLENLGPEKMDGSSLDISEQRRREIKQLFPGVFTETSDADGQPVETIDFERLKAELGTFSDVYEGRRERYGMEWPGKRDCMKLIQEPSRATLKPCREESVDFDTTQNLFIEGDNLEVLKLLQKSYYGKVKMIYIDPPYNTGKEFIYPDKYSESLETYLAYAGLVDDEGKKFSTNTATEGRFHTRWINMMYPRLYLARNLLREDGAIFISIGQDELHNLIRLCDEVFGEENLITYCSRVVKTGGQKGIHFSPSIDYVLCYAKNVVELAPFREEISQNVIENVYTKVETEGEKAGEKYRSMGLYQAMLDTRANQRYFIECPDGSLVIPPGESFPNRKSEGEQVTPGDGDGVWRWTYSRYKSEFERGNIEFIESDRTSLVHPDGTPAKWNVYYKIWLSDRLEEGQLPGNILTKFESRHASSELKKLDIPFDFPKPSALVKYFAELVGIESGDVVLDYFAGSCPTAHAVVDYANETGKAISFICVQLPEKTAESSKEYKAGYKSISDIGKERIRRVLKSIESGVGTNEIGLGVRVFKLDRSCFRQWLSIGGDANINQVVEQLDLHVAHLGSGLDQSDLLYELLLKAGFELSVSVESLELANKTVFSVADGALLICLEDQLTSELIDAVADLEPMQFICLDKGFKGNDQLKANAVQTFKSRSQGAETEMVFKVV